MLKSNSALGLAMACSLAALAVVSTADAGESDIAVVIKVKGTVQFCPPESDAWQAVSAGLVLAAGSRIRTEVDGLAMVKFLADGSMMRLKPQTHLTLAAREAKKGVAVSLGSVFFDIAKRRKGDDAFTVSSPTAVATVKGTAFWVTVGGDSVTVLACTQGVVRVKSLASGKQRDVGAGMTAVCDESGLRVRETAADDVPEGEAAQQLEIRFEDKDGETKTLRIESTPAK